MASRKKTLPVNDAPWFVYVLECTNGRLYTGITTNLEERFLKHASGKGAMFTRINRPSHMLAAIPCENRSAASKLESMMKRFSPTRKRLIISKWPLKTALPHRGHVGVAAGDERVGVDS